MEVRFTDPDGVIDTGNGLPIIAVDIDRRHAQRVFTGVEKAVRALRSWVVKRHGDTEIVLARQNYIGLVWVMKGDENGLIEMPPEIEFMGVKVRPQ